MEDEKPDQNPMPEVPEGDPESWEAMAARVTAEEVNGRYASQLATSFKAYAEAGFTYDQAWALLRDEHRARLEFMNMFAISSDGPDIS